VVVENCILYLMQQTWQQEIAKLSDQLLAVAEQSDRLAIYFGEDKKNFSLHRCLETLHDFLGIVEKTRKVCSLFYAYRVTEKLLSTLFYNHCKCRPVVTLMQH